MNRSLALALGAIYTISAPPDDYYEISYPHTWPGKPVQKFKAASGRGKVKRQAAAARHRKWKAKRRSR